MTWVMVIILAVVAFAIAVYAFKLGKNLWTSLAAALGFGLAGYAIQASPDLPSAPKSAAESIGEQAFDVVQAREEFVAEADQSDDDFMRLSDAMARRGRYAEAAQMLSGITREHPRDFEAWLAQGIALTEHANGNLSQASLYAFQRAAVLRPDSLAPGYFLGVSLVRQGRMMEARQVWRETLQVGPADAAGREGLELRLMRLEGMLGVEAPAQEQTNAPATPSDVSTQDSDG